MLGSFGTSLELRRWSFKIDSWPAWPPKRFSVALQYRNGLPRGRLIEGEPAPCRGSASGNGEPRPKNRKMTGYPPMTQPSKSFEVETDCAAREERRILAR